MPVQKKPVVKRTTPAPRPITPTSLVVTAWETAAKVALTIGALLIPLMVGSWTSDKWELHKSIVLMVVVTVAWICYFLGRLRRPGVAWHWRPIDWYVLALALALLVGTLTSTTWWTSVAGIQGVFSETLPVLLALMSYYFLAPRLFRSTHDRLIVWAALIGAIGFALLLQLFQFSKVSLLPGSLGTDQLFSVLANSSVQVAILAAAVGTFALLLWSQAKERWSKLGLIAMVVVGWLILFFIGQAVAWAVFALGMMFVVISQVSRPQTISSRLIIVAVVLAALGMLSQLMKLNTHAHLPSTNEVSLKQSISAATALSTIAHRPFLGTGPNNWYDAFIHHRPLAYNTESTWSNRYIRSGSEWSQLLATQGVIGTALWLGIILLAGWECWRQLRRGYSFSLIATFFTATALLLTACLTVWSFTLLALFWMALSLGRAKLATTEEQKTTAGTAVPAIGFAVAAIVAIVIWYPTVRIYASQIVLENVQHQIDKQVKPTEIMKTLKLAIRLDSHNSDAGVLLANADVVQFQIDVQANDINAAKEDLAAATTDSRDVVKHNPNNPAIYEAENNVLNSLAQYLPNPEQQANDNFARLRQLEPSNPIHDVGYGQTLLVIRARLAADTTTKADPQKLASLQQQAVQAFNLALSKKSDYLQARYARADAYATGAQYQLALDDLNVLTAAAPTQPAFWTMKGSVLAKLNQADQSKAAFEKAITLSPTDASVYLSYSQTLVDVKKTADAKDVLNRGLLAIPDDQSLKDALAKL